MSEDSGLRRIRAPVVVSDDLIRPLVISV